MSERLCGYQVGRALPNGKGHIAVGSVGGERVIQTLGWESNTSVIDAGRDEQGRVVWVSAHSGHSGEQTPTAIEPATAARPDDELAPVPISRLFQRSEYTPEPIGPQVATGQGESLIAGENARNRFAAPLLARIKFLAARWIGPRRKTVAMGLGIAVVVVAVLLSAPSGTPANTQVKSAPTASSSPGASSAAADAPISDPQSAAIDFAMAGQLPALGVVTGIARAAYSAVVTSRSGDIVLLDVYVTKTSGQKTFATVLLQKAGTQWRMREVFEPKG